MKYVLTTVDFAVGQQRRVVDFYAEYFAKADQKDRLLAFFRSEIGPLNQVVHICRHDGPDSIEDAGELSPISDLITGHSSKVYAPWDVSPPLEAGQFGPFYEMRSYRIDPDLVAQAQAGWAAKLSARTALSPLSVVMQGELDARENVVHFWPYDSLNHRAEIRQQAAERGLWPPKPEPGQAEPMIAQENRIYLPVPFSPMQ